MGEAPPELAEKLLKTFPRLLVESGTLPGAIALYAGVPSKSEGELNPREQSVLGGLPPGVSRVAAKGGSSEV